jgi:hypothetical protein
LATCADSSAKLTQRQHFARVELQPVFDAQYHLARRGGGPATSMAHRSRHRQAPSRPCGGATTASLDVSAVAQAVEQLRKSVVVAAPRPAHLQLGVSLQQWGDIDDAVAHLKPPSTLIRLRSTRAIVSASR